MIHLLRHGALPGNGSARRFIGQTDIPLSDSGRRQAALWRDRWRTIRWAAVWCSDLARSRETARIVAEDAAVPIRISPTLREIDLGAWEGMTFAAVRRRWPAAWEARGKRLADYRPPGGESFADLRDRVIPLLPEIAASSGPVLVAGHAGVNRVMLCHLLGMKLSDLFRIGQDHACLNLIDPDRTPWRVAALNCSMDRAVV
jgi:alpha-ribazole phosphatase